MTDQQVMSSQQANFAGADWPDAIVAELNAQSYNGRVGTVLVSETKHVRVWHLTLPPGRRIGFHRHVNDYFWTVLTAGHAKSRFSDGRVTLIEYRPGDTRHYTFGRDQFMVHDLENIGETALVFVTTEFLDGANDPLPI